MTLRRRVLDRLLRRPATWWGWSCTACDLTGPLFRSAAECHDDLQRHRRLAHEPAPVGIDGH